MNRRSFVSLLASTATADLLAQAHEFDFISMEFLEGKTLTEQLRRGPLPKREAHTIAHQLCSGLFAAHRNKLIHGDLKSNNVMLTTEPDGCVRAVITDFGLARRPDASERIFHRQFSLELRLTWRPNFGAVRRSPWRPIFTHWA
jgi:serine/threonine protein kinase